MSDAVLFVIPLAVACFAILFVVGSSVEPIAGRAFTTEEALAYFPPFGMFVLSLCVALGLWVGLSNAGLTLALWILIAMALAWYVRRLLSTDRDPVPQPAAFRVAMCVLAYVILQVSFIAYPDMRELDPARQMHRAGGLPNDCFIPYSVADFVIERIDPNRYMVVPDWYLSDRPPLAGMVYATFRLTWGLSSYGHFVIVAILLNSLFFFPACLTLKRISGSDQAFRIFFIACLVSCFFSINTWFTWPKLLAASLVMLSLESIESERPAWFSGALAGLGLLSHGTAVFALPALVCRRGLLRNGMSFVKRTMAFVLGSVLTYGPWLFYQRAFHPDSGRMIRWHILGQIDPSDASLWAAAEAYFSQHSPSQLLVIRLTNFLWPFHIAPFWEGLELFAHGDFTAAFRQWHDFSFVFLLGALNPFIVLVTCLTCGWLMFRRGINPLENQKGLLTVAFGSYVISATVFGLDKATVNFQWAYAAVLSLLMMCALVLSRLPRTPLIMLLVVVAVFESGQTYSALRVASMPIGRAPGSSLPLFFNVALTVLAFSLNLPSRQRPDDNGLGIGLDREDL